MKISIQFYSVLSGYETVDRWCGYHFTFYLTTAHAISDMVQLLLDRQFILLRAVLRSDPIPIEWMSVSPDHPLPRSQQLRPVVRDR